MVRTLVDADGIETISMLDSWLTWRTITNNFDVVRQKVGRKAGPITSRDLIDAMEESTCPFCNGEKSVQDVTHGLMYCLCTMLDWQCEVAKRMEPYRSYVPNKSLDELEITHGTLEEAIAIAGGFITYPSRWITLLGDTGCGKSHILASIAKSFGSMALYIGAEDIEQHLYEATEGSYISEYLYAVRQAPILLLDDCGIEHGTHYVQAKLRAVINYRYSLWQDFPTVVASNYSPKEAKDKDRRIASRIRDVSKVDTILIKAGDYRTMPKEQQWKR